MVARRAERAEEIAARLRLPRHAHAASDFAQHPGKPRLVYRLHAVPGGNFARPPGSAAEFPDHGGGPDRPARGKRLAAGRGDGGGRGRGHGARCGQGQILRHRRCDRLAPANPRRAADARHRGWPDAARFRTGRYPGHGRRETFRGGAAISRHHRRAARPESGNRRRARGRRLGHCRRRPAGPVPAYAAGRNGCRRRGRQRATVRRGNGLRRPARRVLRHARPVPPPHAGPHRRRQPGCRRPVRAAPGPANPRATHPPRKGDEQHLHRASAACHHRRFLRRLARAGRAAAHRHQGESRCTAAGRRRGARRLHPAIARFLRHDHPENRRCRGAAIPRAGRRLQHPAVRFRNRMHRRGRNGHA